MKMITKENIKELTENELKICYLEYRKRIREGNKDTIKKTNNKHYIKRTLKDDTIKSTKTDIKRTLKKKDKNSDNILKSKRTLKKGDLNIFN